VVSVMRKDRVYPDDWSKLWHEIETRMTELEKKLTYSPNRDLVRCGEVLFEGDIRETQND
jgi:hypothetical protein